jgi:hypothetical protein
MATQPTAYGDEYGLKGYAEFYEIHALSGDAVGSGVGAGGATLNNISSLWTPVGDYSVGYGKEYGHMTRGVGTGSASMNNISSVSGNGLGAGSGFAPLALNLNLRGVRHLAGYGRDPYGGAYADGTQVIFGSEGIGKADTDLSRRTVYAADASAEGLADVHLSRVAFVEGSALGVGNATGEVRRVKLLDADALGEGITEAFFVHVTEVEETSCGVLIKEGDAQGVLVYSTESEGVLLIEECDFTED